MTQSWKKMSAAIGITAALLLMLAVVGLAQHGGGPGGRGPGGRGFHGGPPHDGLGPIARDLNLTDAQQAEVKKITAAFEESTKSLRDQLEAQRPDGLPNFATFDEAAVRAAAQARANLHVEMEVARARMMSQIFNVLTTEQKAQLEAKRQEHEQRRKEFEANRPKDSEN